MRIAAVAALAIGAFVCARAHTPTVQTGLTPATPSTTTSLAALEARVAALDTAILNSLATAECEADLTTATSIDATEKTVMSCTPPSLEGYTNRYLVTVRGQLYNSASADRRVILRVNANDGAGSSVIRTLDNFLLGGTADGTGRKWFTASATVTAGSAFTKTISLTVQDTGTGAILNTPDTWMYVTILTV